MKKSKQLIIAALMVLGFAGALLPIAPTAGAINVFNGSACSGANAKSDICKAKGSDTLKGYVKPIVNILLYILGVVAVIMIIVGAFMYVTSAGDATAVTKAKNTIMYSVVGLVVAILAYAIVNFVINAIK